MALVFTGFNFSVTGAQATNSTPISWVHQLGSTAGDTVTATTVDAAGYVYFVGNAAGTVTGSLSSLGVSGANVNYVSKFHPDGTPVWTKQVSITGTQRLLESVAVDAAGNVFVSGLVNGTVSLGGSVPDLVNGTSNRSAFVAKFDLDGNAQASSWLVNPRHFDYQSTSQVRLDAQGNVYVIATSHGDQKVAYAKFTNNLVTVWQRYFDGGGYYRLYNSFSAFAIDQQTGEIYIGGYFKTTIAFSGSVSLTSSGPGVNGYVLKLDNLGEPIWAKRFVSSVSDASITSLSIDSSGNVFASGFSSGTLTFPDGSTTTATSVPTGNNFPDAFAIKMDASGALVWKTIWGGTSDDRTYGITVASDGKIYVTGKFRGASTFGGSFACQVVAYPTNAATDAYLLELSSAGVVSWVQTFGGATTSTQTDSFESVPSVLGDQVFVGGTADGLSQGSALTTLGGSDGFFVAVGRDASPAHSCVGSDAVTASSLPSLTPRPAASSSPSPTASSTPAPSASASTVAPAVISPQFNAITARNFDSKLGGAVTVTGSHLGAISRITVDGTLAKITSVTDSKIEFVAPAGKPGTPELNIEFTNGSMSWSNALTYFDVVVEKAKLDKRIPKPVKVSKLVKVTKPVKQVKKPKPKN
jgi:hypothetical protein